MHRLFLNVGYELSEQQLHTYFAKFGAITDLYLPKHVNGRNKGYGFLTYATKSAHLSVAQQPRHIVHGRVVQVRKVGTPVCFFGHTCLLLCQVLLCVCVFQSVSLRACFSPDRPSASVPQVKLAGPRPVRESKPLATPCKDFFRDFGRGHRLYVGGVANGVTKEGVQQHFTKWGDVLDVYFPAARGLSRSNYCFVTFANHESTQQAYRQAERSIDGWVSNLHIAVVHSCGAI